MSALVDDELLGRVDVLLGMLAERSMTVAAAESLTAGLLTAVLTEPAGASAVVRGGLVVYATDLKTTLCGVPAELLAAEGPVSSAVAGALATGVRTRLGADLGVALTGVAGPDPQGSAPVGLVFGAVADGDGAQVRERRIDGDRAAVRVGAVSLAIELLMGAAQPT